VGFQAMYELSASRLYFASSDLGEEIYRSLGFHNNQVPVTCVVGRTHCGH